MADEKPTAGIVFGTFDGHDGIDSAKTAREVLSGIGPEIKSHSTRVSNAVSRAGSWIRGNK